MVNMRFLAGFAATLFFVGPLFAAEQPERIKSDAFERRLEAGKTFRLAKVLDTPVNLQVLNAVGSIEVSKGTGKDLQVEGVYEGGDPAKLRVDTSGRTVNVSVEYPGDAGGVAESQVSVNGKTYRAAGNVSVTITVTNGRVFIDGKDVTNDPQSAHCEVRLRILVPNDLLLDLTSKETAGDSVVTGLDNHDREIRVESTSGRAVLRESAGKHMIAKSMSGEVLTEGTRGDLDASSISGSVRVSNHEGDVLAASVSGGVQVLTTTGRVHAKTISGSVRLTNPQATSEQTESVSGSVRRADR